MASVFVSEDRQSFTINGHAILMITWQSFIHSIIRDASTTLSRDLLFTSPTLLDEIPISELQDNRSIIQDGHSFVTNPENASTIKEGFTNIIANLERQPNEEVIISRTASFDDATGMIGPMQKSLTWPIATAYLANTSKFLELLLMCIVTCGGCPPQGEDLLYVRIVDEPPLERGICILLGMVVIVPADLRPGKEHPILRFLPPRVGAMVVVYLTDVLPVLRGLEIVTEEYKKNNFLFRTERGARWGSSKYEEIMRRETKARVGLELGLDAYKAVHLAIAEVVQPGAFGAEGYLQQT